MGLNFRLASPSKMHTKISNQKPVEIRVSKVVEKHLDSSLLNGNKKQKQKFETLTKGDKRAWRESLQRAISSCKNRYAGKALSGQKMRGKARRRIQHLSNLESELLWGLSQSNYDVDFQSGLMSSVSGAATVVAAASASYAFGKTAQVVSQAGQALSDINEKASEILDNATAASSSMKSALGSTDSLVTGFTDAIHNFVDKVKEYGLLVWKPALIALSVWILTNYAHVNIIVAAVVACVVAYLPEAKQLFERFVPRGIHFQSGNVSLFADLITMVMTCWCPGKDVKQVSGEFLKRSSVFVRASDGVEVFITKLLNLCEEMLNFVLRRKDEQRITLTGKKDAYKQWKSEVIAILKYMAQETKPPIQEIRKAKDLQIRGFGFHQVLATFESKRDLSYWMEKLSISIAPHEGAIATENNMRPMPFCIMVGGASGVGKTTLLRMIGCTILMLARECTSSNALENLWQKGTTEYWNGYIGQKCLVMDDCFQVKAKPGDMDSEAMQLIRGIGNWSYPLNFADLASKGKMYLDTPLVIGTTNCKNITAEWAPFITEPRALVRRFQTSVWAEVNDEYLNEHGKFDYDKVNEMFGNAVRSLAARSRELKQRGQTLALDDIMSALPWNVWKLHPHSFDKDNIPSDELPGGLRAVVEQAAREIRRRKTGNRGEIEDMRSLLDVISDALGDEVEEQVGLRSFKLETTSQDSDSCDRVSGEIRSSESYEARMSMLEQVMEDDALSAEDNHEGIFEHLFHCWEQWIGFISGALPSIKMVLQFARGYAAFVLLKSVWKIVSSIVKGIVNTVTSVITSVLDFLGVRQKCTTLDFQSNVKEQPQAVKGKHIDVPTFNFTGAVQLQVGVPPNEAVHDHVYMNTVKCYTEEGTIGQFIGIGSDVYIFPKHYLKPIEQLDPNVVLYFKSAKHGSQAEISVSAFLAMKRVEMTDYDIAAVSFDKVFLKATRNILKYFLTQHEVKNILRGSNASVRLDVASLGKENSLQRVIHISPTCSPVSGSVVTKTGTTVKGLVRYVAPTVVGDCGAPLTLSESRHYGGRCIIGMHSAGRDNAHMREGFATVITQEVAREIFYRLVNYIDEGAESVLADCPLPEGDELIQLQDALTEKGVCAGSFELIGKLQVPINLPTKTSLKASKMQRDELFGPSPTAPAVLRAKEVDGILLEPMVNGLKAYQTPLICRDSRDMDAVTDLAMQKHWSVTQHHSRDVLTFEEAIVPPAGWKLKPINRKTAAGYKYASFVGPKTPGKTAFLGHEGDVDFGPKNKNLAIVRDNVMDIISKARERVRILHLCTDFLKDELRPLHKVKAVATRVISGTPFDYTIAIRMYFGAFMAAMFDTNVSNGMAPGVNHYREWYKIPEFLEFPKVFDGDFGRFDATEMPWVHEAILRYINSWYAHNSPGHRTSDDIVRDTLWLDLVHSRHISGYGSNLQYVVQWNKSLPSGHPLTTVVNSMYSLITLTGCYVHATGDIFSMWDHVRFVTFGDDNVNSVDDTVCEDFNQVTVARDMLKLFDLNYTAGDKSGNLVPYKTIEEATFLKRSFVLDDDKCGLIANRVNVGWVAPLAKDSYLFEPYWYKSNRDPRLDLVTRIEHSLCEMALHSQDVWNEHVPSLLEWGTRNGVEIKLSTRAAARQHVKTRFDIWF